MASVRWKQMHNTTLMRLFTKPYIRWEKSAQLPIKPQQPKQPREKKQKKTSRKPKKTKKTRVSGKGLGGHFSQITRFFCFFWFSRGFFVFLFFFVFFGLLEVFFCFFWFFKRFLRSVFGSASIWIVHNRFCPDCTFSTELCARCPTACL